MSEEHKPLLRQAPVRALDPDGVGVVSIGTLLFLVATIVCLIARDYLEANGLAWITWVAATGFAMGLVGTSITYSWHRRRRSGAKAND
jgi:hypothetical protein